MSTRSTSATNDKALAAFVAAKAEIDARLERLKSLSDDHFHANPDEIHWGHAGDVQRYANLLREMTDIAFSEGECAD